MRRAAALVLASWVAALTGAAAAHARELPDTVRRMAERAFLEGRLHDLDDILAGAEELVDRLPLVLRDAWWRTTVPRPEEASVPAGADLAARRMAWLIAPEPGTPAWPGPGGGAEDPYPILTALIADRVRRETRGHEGLPTRGPLAALAKELDPRGEKRAIWFLDEHGGRMMSVAYRGAPPYPARVEADRQAEELRARNGLLAAVALAAFLLLSLALGAWTRRPR